MFAATIVSPTEIIQIFLFSLHARYVSFFLDNNNLLTEYFKCKQTNAQIRKIQWNKIHILVIAFKRCFKDETLGNIYFDNLFEMPFRGPGISFENGLFLVGYQWVMGKICKGALVIYSQEDKKQQHQLKRI